MKTRQQDPNNDSEISLSYNRVFFNALDSKIPDFTYDPIPIKKYDIDNKSDLLELEKSINNGHFKYLSSPYEDSQDKIKIIKHPLLNEWNVIADQDLKKDTLIGYYIGTTIPYTEAKKRKNSEYYFNIVNSKNEPIAVIDAFDTGNFLRFVNGSQANNVVAVQEQLDGKNVIAVYASVDIKKEQHLLLDYGNQYKFAGPPMNFHPDDDIRPDIEVYLANKNDYLSSTFNFAKHIRQKLALKNQPMLIPSIFIPIRDNNIKDLKKYLDMGFPVNLCAYACNAQGLAEVKSQEHMNALILACYLGRKECIEMLLAHGANVERATLWSGITPLQALMKGEKRENKKLIEDIAELLLEKLKYPQRYDSNTLSLMHYAIDGNYENIVKKLLALGEKHEVDVCALMFNREDNLPSHKDLDTCVIEGKFSILRILLAQGLKSSLLFEGKIIEYIKKKIIFEDKTLENTSLINLLRLSDLLKEAEFSSLQNIELKTRIKKFIAKKSNHTQTTFAFVNKTTTITPQLIRENKLDEIDDEVFFNNSLHYTCSINVDRHDSPLFFAIWTQNNAAIATIIERMQAYIITKNQEEIKKLLTSLNAFACLSLAKLRNFKNLETLIHPLLQIYQDHPRLLIENVIRHYVSRAGDRAVIQQLKTIIKQSNYFVFSENDRKELLELILVSHKSKSTQAYKDLYNCICGKNGILPPNNILNNEETTNSIRNKSPYLSPSNRFRISNTLNKENTARKGLQNEYNAEQPLVRKRKQNEVEVVRPTSTSSETVTLFSSRDLIRKSQKSDHARTQLPRLFEVSNRQNKERNFNKRTHESDEQPLTKRKKI